MKKLILILIFSFVVSAQENVKQDSIDIRSLVTEQINAVKIKEDQTAVKNIKAELIPQTSIKVESGSRDYTYHIIFFLIEIVLAASLIFLWIKRKEINNKYAVKYLKLNIAKLRKEKIGTKINDDLSRLRTTLIAQPINVNDHGRDITYKAKKYSISKGEVHLAAKLKMLAERSR
jgi:hypothetical protein